MLPDSAGGVHILAFFIADGQRSIIYDIRNRDRKQIAPGVQQFRNLCLKGQETAFMPQDQRSVQISLRFMRNGAAPQDDTLRKK